MKSKEKDEQIKRMQAKYISFVPLEEEEEDEEQQQERRQRGGREEAEMTVLPHILHVCKIVFTVLVILVTDQIWEAPRPDHTRHKKP